MVRVAGFLTGSAVAIVLILLVLGVPELRAPEQEPVAVVVEAPEPPPEPEPEPEPAADLPPEPQPEPQPESPPEPQPDAVSEPEPVMANRWHSFWSPFGSRIAADGFVSRLESVTGFDYRVIKIENGVYEVVFAYTDDSERDAMLATIASATGLDLPDS